MSNLIAVFSSDDPDAEEDTDASEVEQDAVKEGFIYILYLCKL